MLDKFDKILNECIDRINGGQTVAACVADYPEQADDLQPMLDAMFTTKSAFASIPTTPAKQRARQRMMAAIRQPKAKPRTRTGFAFPNILRNMKVLATAAAVLVIALVSYFSVTLTTAPQIVPAIANEEGNFALLISDEPNDIGDFTSLTMIVDKIQLKSADEGRKWIEIDTEDTEVDLALLQGDNAFEIWRGDVPLGNYSEAVLYSNSVSGVLVESGETVNIKLPSGKLSLKGDFSVGSDEEVTDFVYDITVIGTPSGKYILQPNTNESGTAQQVNRVNRQGQPQDQGDGQGQGGDGQGGGSGNGQGNGQGQS